MPKTTSSIDFPRSCNSNFSRKRKSFSFQMFFKSLILVQENHYKNLPLFLCEYSSLAVIRNSAHFVNYLDYQVIRVSVYTCSIHYIKFPIDSFYFCAKPFPWKTFDFVTCSRNLKLQNLLKLNINFDLGRFLDSSPRLETILSES